MTRFRLNKQGWFIIGTLSVVLFLFYLSNNKPGFMSHHDVISIRKLLIACVHLSEDAGSVIKLTYNPAALHTRIKNDEGGPKNELITDIDVKSHNVIVSGLNSQFPGITIVSEEHPPMSTAISPPHVAASHSNVEDSLPNTDMFVPVSDLTVWVDPLDATQELTEGLLEYVTVMICVALQGRPIVGVIHQPFLNQTYWAWNSYDVSDSVIQAQTAKVKSAAPLDQSLVITYSRSHLDNTTEEKIAKSLAPQNVAFLPAGGSGFKVLSLLNGRAQLYVHPASTRRWDICAAHSILEAVGGRMTGLDGSQLKFDKNSPHVVPSTTGLLAASSISNHYLWRSKLSVLVNPS